MALSAAAAEDILAGEVRCIAGLNLGNVERAVEAMATVSR